LTSVSHEGEDARELCGNWIRLGYEETLSHEQAICFCHSAGSE
jgi:hypothetical protein